MTSLARMIREARAGLRMSGPALARAAGISLRTLRYWEAGAVRPHKAAFNRFWKVVMAARRGDDGRNASA